MLLLTVVTGAGVGSLLGGYPQGLGELAMDGHEGDGSVLG